MKKSEIDRWMRHQAYVCIQVARPAVNWALIASVLIVVGALIFIVLRVAGVL